MVTKLNNADDDLQKSIWEKHTAKINVNQEMLQSPAFFQKELAELMRLLTKPNSKCIEVGCEFGITSYLLPKTYEKSFLDYNEDALNKCKELGVFSGDKGHYILCDMFQVGTEYTDRFDLVFNAGVIEHYDIEDRVKLLISMSKMVTRDGIVVVAFPNHYSFPYRLAYRLMVVLGKWKFPKEFKLYDLEKEAVAAGMVQCTRLTISKASLFSWLNPKPFFLFQVILRLLDKVNSFEGYLTCIILQKKRVEING